ncbi:putative ATPase/DNA-binding winged helix-turn-helix (wHTH) protein [Paraburkholderia sp. GAS199]|uniref:winged helix-turn-helix domain-containing protein n=1 Tax=Paraburkholderia sp. GAS199 TaxID=3035126 RepID=UPI003D1D83DB
MRFPDGGENFASPLTGPQDITFGSFRISIRERRVMSSGKVLPIGDRAFDILMALVSRAGEIVSKAELTNLVWPDTVVDEVNLRVQVFKLRKALGERPGEPKFIESVAGRGYCFIGALNRHVDRSHPGIVGRRADIAAVAQLLLVRSLVTIVGPGGVGKSTVATAVLKSVAQMRDVRSVVVDLSSVSSARLVSSALAAAVGAPVNLATPLDAVINALRCKQMVLLLDSCEHVLEAVAELVEAVQEVAPEVLILSTSRQPLNARSEWLYHLQPLEIPKEASTLAVDRALQYPSVQLFLERCRSKVDTFELTPDNVETVCQIVKALDGLPLALELAASQVKILGVSRLLTGLTDRFEILTQGNRAALPRHRTLRATLDYSYDILLDAEKAALRQLAIFAGNFDFDAGAAVAGAMDNPESFFYPVLTALVDNSLVSVVRDAEPVQYRLLDSTRAYALEKLRDAGEDRAASGRHASYLLRLLRSKESGHALTAKAEWEAASKRLIGDVRGALDWAFSPSGNVTLGCRITVAAAPVWHQFALMTEYRERSMQALIRLEDERLVLPDVDLRLHLALGHADFNISSLSTGIRSPGYLAFATALEKAVVAGELKSQIDALYGLVILMIKDGDYVAAMGFVDRLGELRHTSLEATTMFHRLRAIVTSWDGRPLDVLADVDMAANLYAQKFVDRDAPMLMRYDHESALEALRARSLWEIGQIDSAVAVAHDCIEDVIALGHPLSICHALVTGGCPVMAWTGDDAALTEFVGHLEKIAQEQSLEFWKQWVLVLMEGLAVSQARVPADLFKFTGFGPLLQDLLVTMNWRLLTPATSARADDTTAGFAVPEVYRARGERLLERQGKTAAAEARQLFMQSIETARKNSAISWELRGTMSLARLLLVEDRRDEAAQLLEDILRRFDQGFGTRDLIEANNLLVRAGGNRVPAGRNATVVSDMPSHVPKASDLPRS